METVQSNTNSFNISDLTEEEQALLRTIQETKQQLLFEIQELKKEIEDVTNELVGMDLGDENKPDPKAKQARQISIGRKKFNMDPKK
ncbi:cytohesin, partial [Elysia marginata]